MKLLKMVWSLVFTLVCFLVPPTAEAEWFSDYGAGLYGGYFSVDADTAAQQGVDDEGYVFGVRMDSSIHDVFVLNAGGGLVAMDDKDQFEQRVITTGLLADGDISTESSDIEGYSLFVEGGVRTPSSLSDKVRVGVNVGYNFVDLERTISNCTDCREDDIDFDAGVYAHPNLVIEIGHVKLEGGYTYFFDQDGIENMWQVAATFMFGPGSSDR